ncbi:MAG: tetratricopeptide repeat protein [Candidatus Omnitrophica bacterium]|nr:tetratricopeptide repeat protein [Candidatus Omnitrophota bacterium]
MDRSLLETIEVSVALAASGKPLEALQELESIPPAPPSFAVLSLRAKLLAQLGRLPEAIACWEEVLSLCPNDTESQKCLELARRTEAGDNPPFPWPPLAWAPVLLVLMLIGIMGGALYIGMPKGAPIRAQLATPVPGEQPVPSSPAPIQALVADHWGEVMTELRGLKGAVGILDESLETLARSRVDEQARLSRALKGIGQALGDELSATAHSMECTATLNLRQAAELAQRIEIVSEKLEKLEGEMGEIPKALEDQTRNLESAGETRLETVVEIFSALRSDLSRGIEARTADATFLRGLKEDIENLSRAFQRYETAHWWIKNVERTRFLQELLKVKKRLDTCPKETPSSLDEDSTE